MAVPKKRTGKKAQATRRANWKATKPETTICSNCGQPVLAHTVCTACGFYKGKPVSLKDKDKKVEVKKEEVKEVVAEQPAEEVVETKTEAPKKTTRKKAVKKEEGEEKPKKTTTKKTTKKAEQKPSEE